MTPVKVIQISGITETAEKTVTVIDAATGEELKLPRREINFVPGGVIIPIWLMKKIFKKTPGRMIA